MADKKQALADTEALIKNLLDWQNKQPEYTTGIYPDDDLIICPVDRLQLARYAETAKSLLPPDRQEAFRIFAGAIGQNSIPGALITLSPLLDALCELRRKLGGNGNLKRKPLGEVAGLDTKTPKNDTTLIRQKDAEAFYNIPKSTLSKAAKKNPGEPGYLWTTREGKSVFYRKSDCEKISKSRAMIRNNLP